MITSKIKTFFAFLPALLFTCLGGLTAVLSKDQAIQTTYADSMSLVSTRTFSDVQVNYQSVTYDRVRHNFSYNLSFYYDNLRGSYFLYFDLTFNPNNSSLNTYGIGIDGGGFYPCYFDEAFTYHLVFDNLSDLGFNGVSTRNLYFSCVGISSSSDAYVASYDTVMFASQYTFELYIEGFTRTTAILETNLANNYVVEGFTVPSSDYNLFNYRTIAMNDYFSLANYSIDLAQNNYTIGYADGYSVGYADGQAQGYADGYSTGNANGYSQGYAEGRASRNGDVTNAYNEGYAAGFAEGNTANGTAITIFNGILQIGMLPVNILLAIFNFEILGINLSAFVSAILTVCLTIIVIRTIMGGKSE